MNIRYKRFYRLNQKHPSLLTFPPKTRDMKQLSLFDKFPKPKKIKTSEAPCSENSVEVKLAELDSHSVVECPSEGQLKTSDNADDDNRCISLSKEAEERMNLNRLLAVCRKNVKSCEKIVLEAQKNGCKLPPLEALLIEPSWKLVLAQEFNKPYFSGLEKFLLKEVSGNVPIFPPLPLVFRAFNSSPMEEVKVVIIGQDPYHGIGQAMGLSFSVPHGIRPPPSLQNIFKEIVSDIGGSIPGHGNLEKWAAQGVLLLNTVLTVRQGQANSHSKKGWETFTDSTIKEVSKKGKNLVFFLWGNHAQQKESIIDSKSHLILKAAHPSGLSAHKGFFGCRHFSKANTFLQENGKVPIVWI